MVAEGRAPAGRGPDDDANQWTAVPTRPGEGGEGVQRHPAPGRAGGIPQGHDAPDDMDGEQRTAVYDRPPRSRPLALTLILFGVLLIAGSFAVPTDDPALGTAQDGASEDGAEGGAATTYGLGLLITGLLLLVIGAGLLLMTTVLG